MAEVILSLMVVSHRSHFPPSADRDERPLFKSGDIPKIVGGHGQIHYFNHAIGAIANVDT